MDIVAGVLSLRRNQTSSVKALLAAIEWTLDAPIGSHSVARAYAATQAADIVLLNVAAHAAEALNQSPPPHGVRAPALPSRRRPRRPNREWLSNQNQRRLFA